ncbi:MAG TPA: CoA transferase [Gaiellaceae bacterium]|jgi:crotonobetainyl-CoA:carnitine CoA-transferase CaiB-like acyl-CoA transferase
MKPLDGIRIVDITASLAGPTCTQLLGALGAEVVKVEPPEGDHARAWGPPFIAASVDGEADDARPVHPDADGAGRDRMGALFFAANAGKRSVVLELREEREKLLELVAAADVLVLSLRPGLAEELGLAADDLRERNPRLIHCTIGAYGRGGPLSDRPGYDPLMQAAAGIMSVTGEPDGPPVRVGISLIDFATGQWAAIGILAALLERERTGAGCTIDTSLYESALYAMSPHVAAYESSGDVPGRYGSAFPLIAPYELFPTSDGAVMISAGSDALWERLRGALGLADDERFRTNPDRVAHRTELFETIAAVLRTATSADWEERLTAAGVPVSPVRDLGEALAHPQTEALGILQQLGNGTTVSLPLRFDGERPRYSSAPPTLGH